MKTLVVVSVILTICLASTNALTCYDCVYFEGHMYSDDQCANNPSSTQTCGALSLNNSLPLPVRAQYKKNDTVLFSTDEKESRQDWMQLCSKFTGTVDGRSIIARGCFMGIRELSGICTRDDVFLEVDGQYASNVRGCFCSGDRCNSASGLQVTYLLALIVGAVHILSRCKQIFNGSIN